MEQIVHIEAGDPEEAQDLAKALEIGAVLERHYPNHAWLISFQGHALIIRHLAIANAVTMATGKEGFGSLLPRDLTNPKTLSAQAVRFAGALLEAFGLPRGPWDGRDPVVPEDLRQAAMAGRSLQ